MFTQATCVTCVWAHTNGGVGRGRIYVSLWVGDSLFFVIFPILVCVLYVCVSQVAAQ